MATLKGKRHGGQGEQQTPQTTGRESDIERQMSQALFCLVLNGYLKFRDDQEKTRFGLQPE